MEVSSLKELYFRINKNISTVFVVPLIRFRFPKTDYLYLLYQDFFTDQNEIKIESISVFNHYIFVLSALLRRNSILHYHWLEFQTFKALLGMPYKLLCIFLFNLFGGKIVWTVHNLSPHDKKYLTLHRSIHRWMAGKSSLIHVHSKSAVPIVSNYFEVNEDKIIILSHPKFPFEIIPKEQATKDFLNNYTNGLKSLDNPVFLIFGGISEYKGIREIVDILTAKEEPFTLIIAGYVKVGQEPLHEFIIQKTIADKRVIYIPTFIPEDHYPFLLNASDICVFNYDEILTSGGVAMAQAYEKEIIAPNKGCLQDLSGKKNISLFSTKENLKELLHSALNRFNLG